MKFTSMRSLLALGLALTLTACGGGKATYTIPGTVSNLQYGPLVLTSNGMDVTVNPSSTLVPPVYDSAKVPAVTFEFPKQLEYGDQYLVTVKQQPPHQTCAIPKGYEQDTVGHRATINVPVNCLLQSHAVGGTVSGLTATGLVLVNGGGTLPLASGTTEFTFPNPVIYGQTYGVTVLSNPTGLFCSVNNGAGTMQDADVANITVTCVPSA
ncbi:hypothetical protein NX773_13620 [Massilia solisilvae]|uniref:Lipoprotein n=1 Tax=Massilia solisilvae TaxID=1811225 RepID=A0ABT2BL20_9BURK|nr:hypothetical protein [Massilia solisilvae]MCS0609206.1 hypothetical protein [Massilia solisilvae]